MKIYAAGNYVDTSTDLYLCGFLPRLLSYYHVHVVQGFGSQLWDDIMKRKTVELFLDSGAFSAWTQGLEIDVHNYIEFIKEHEDVIDVYANLDVIGVGGKQPNRLTAQKTLENQQIMEQAGLSPIPVFHYGEPEEEFLKYYVDNYDYVALGVAGNTGNKLKPWLDRCFDKYICDRDGIPKKIHGFAVTSLEIMLRFPWYSVDSTSWVITGRTGSIYVPQRKDGKWIYDETSLKVAVSSRGPSSTDANKHFSTMTPNRQRLVLDYIEEKGYKIGKSEFKMVDQSYTPGEWERWAEKKPKDKSAKRKLEIIHEPGLCNQYYLRDEINIIYFLDLEQSMPEWPWKFRTGKPKGFLSG